MAGVAVGAGQRILPLLDLNGSFVTELLRCFLDEGDLSERVISVDGPISLILVIARKLCCWRTLFNLGGVVRFRPPAFSES